MLPPRRGTHPSYVNVKHRLDPAVPVLVLLMVGAPRGIVERGGQNLTRLG